MEATIKQSPPWDAGSEDPAQTARVLGAFLLSGGLLVVLAMLIADPVTRSAAALLAIGGAAAAAGATSIIWASRARAWMVHALFAAGTALICVGIYLAGTATGAYAVMFLWLVVIAASFFSARATVAHLAWILVASGAAFSSAQEAGGLNPAARWALGSLLLLVAGAVMGRIVAGRRATEAQLRLEIAHKEQLQRELEHLAHHDSLTGLANRRRFEQELARELAQAARQGVSLSVLALDLDGLKAYNDTHGHAAGDHLLKRAGSTWATALREADLIARMGGDEFVALLPDCDSEQAAGLVQRLERGYPDGHSFSAGIACWDRQESGDQLLRRADAAMYRAKEGGGRAARGTDPAPR